MFIGLKNGKIVAFNNTRRDLEINASTKQITLDTIEETDEEIVPYYNTVNDGIYFKKSEVPQTPVEIANASIKSKREELYAKLSDPITNEIAVLKDEIEYGEYSGELEIDAKNKLMYLHNQRKIVRQQIVVDHPYAREEI